MDFGRYLVAATLAYVIIWWLLRPLIKHRKIQTRAPKPGQRIWEFGFSARTAIIFASVGLCVFLGSVFGLFEIYEDISERGWFYWGATLAGIIVAHDAYFYWMHRAMHDRRLFRSFHWTHHRSTAPTPWAAYSFDILEALVMALFMLLFVAFVPVHGAVLGIFALHQITRNVIGHAGFELFPKWWADNPLADLMTTTTHHDLHHQNGNYNFGLYFTWWDRLMGTEHPEYKARYRAITSDSVEGTEPVARTANATI